MGDKDKKGWFGLPNFFPKVSKPLNVPRPCAELKAWTFSLSEIRRCRQEEAPNQKIDYRDLLQNLPETIHTWQPSSSWFGISANSAHTCSFAEKEELVKLSDELRRHIGMVNDIHEKYEEKEEHSRCNCYDQLDYLSFVERGIGKEVQRNAGEEFL